MSATLLQDIPEEQYFALPGISSSVLKGMAKPKPKPGLTMTPALKKALRIGKALDVFETRDDEWDDTFVPPLINPKTLKQYGDDTKAWAEHVAKHPGKQALSLEERRLVSDMSRTLHNQPEYHEAHGLATFQDVIIFDYKGHKAKAMLDLRVDGQVWDIKTCAKSDKWGFYRSARDLFYDIQAFWYCEAVRALTGHTPDFYFAVVDKDPEPSAAIYPIEPDECMEDWVDSLVARVVADDWAMPESKQMNEPIRIPRDFQGSLSASDAGVFA